MRHVLITTCLTICSVAAITSAIAEELPVINAPVIDASEVRQPLDAPRAPDAALSLSYGGYTGMQYRSNIYRETSNETDDFIAVVAPAFTLRSDLDRHAITVKGMIEAGHFLLESDNDYVDADLRANSRYDVTNDSFIDLHGQWRYDHVDVGGFSTDLSDLTRRSEEPTPYNYGEAGILYETPLNDMLIARAGVTGLYFNYSNVNTLGGTPIIQDDRDRYEVIGTGLLAYQAQPNLLPFVAVDVNIRRYDKRVDATALYERDSSGVGVFVGSEYNDEKEDDVWAAGRIGFLHQDYDNDFLPDVNTLGLDGEAGYRFNETTRVVAKVARAVMENTFFGGSSAVQTTADTVLYHDIAPAWVIDGKLRYTINDFQINPTGGRKKREDTIYENVIGATYTIANPLYLRAQYGYANRTSDEARAEYNDNSVMFLVGMTY